MSFPISSGCTWVLRARSWGLSASSKAGRVGVLCGPWDSRRRSRIPRTPNDMINWFRNRRRRKLVSQPFPQEWLRHLHRNVRHFDLLSKDEQARLLDLARIFIAEKYW